MPRRSSLRASDTDRDTVADRLRAAATEGRLTTDELDERVSTALRARTYGELDQLVADLPAKRLVSAPRRNPALAVVSAAAVALAAVAVLAVAVAVITGIATIWMIWVAFSLILGRRRRMVRGTWACSRGARRLTQAERGAAGGYSPWL
jgi:hypothetical protein